MQMMDLFCWFRVVIFKTPVMHIMHYRWRNNFGARQLTPILARVRLRKVYLSPKTVIASPRRGRGDPETFVHIHLDCFPLATLVVAMTIIGGHRRAKMK
ncbi:MAG TPA: hypothetical protein DEP85_06645 [Holosporales bacterium]|nr:hypothetical protein [Holosporales bacterium]